MATKKTKNKIVEKPVEAVAYYGKVKIQFSNGKKIYKTINQHNAGTSSLFKYIANCIIGNYNQSLMPRYVHTFYCSQDKINEILQDETNLPQLWNYENSTCAVNVPFDTVQIRADSSSSSLYAKPYVAEFTFNIPYTQIQDTTNIVALYNVSEYKNATPLAYVILEGDDIIQLASTNTSNIIITWELVVSNQTNS